MRRKDRESNMTQREAYNKIATRGSVRAQRRQRKVKAIITTTLLLITTIIALLIVLYISTRYTKEAVVIDTTNNTVVFYDEGGHEWKCSADNVVVGQKVVLRMYNNNTDSIITDDVIVGIKPTEIVMQQRTVVESPMAHSHRAFNKKSAEIHRQNNIKTFPKRLDKYTKKQYNNSIKNKTREVKAMTYNVYSIRKGNYRYILGVTRTGLTKKDAMLLAKERNNNPNKKCNYVVVAENNILNFFLELERKNDKLAEARDKKWAEIEAMRKRGYVVKDVLEYLNK